MASESRLCVGVIAGAHGVRGLVRVKSHTATPCDIAAYRPLTDAAGQRRFDLEIVGEVRGLLLARVAGIDDRNSAERLRGVELFIERAQLPPVEEKDEYYYADLVGMESVLSDGTGYGIVAAVHDFGAGAMIEVALSDGGNVVLPFSADVFPEVDTEGGRIVTVPPHIVDVTAADDDSDDAGGDS